MTDVTSSPVNEVWIIQSPTACCAMTFSERATANSNSIIFFMIMNVYLLVL